MAIDSAQLVIDQLEPVLGLDSTLEAVIPRQVEAEIALRGYSISEIDDQKAVYISKLATKALIPRLLLKFSQSLKKAVGGPAEAEFQDAIRFLEALQTELQEQVKAAAKHADPGDAVEPGAIRPTLTGIRSI